MADVTSVIMYLAISAKLNICLPQPCAAGREGQDGWQFRPSATVLRGLCMDTCTRHGFAEASSQYMYDTEK